MVYILVNAVMVIGLLLININGDGNEKYKRDFLASFRARVQG